MTVVCTPVVLVSTLALVISTVVPAPIAARIRSTNASGNCIRSIQDDWKVLLRAEASAATSVGTTFIDTQSWFCIEALCPAFVDKSAVYADSSHLTATYSESIGAVLQEKLQSLKIAPPSA